MIWIDTSFAVEWLRGTPRASETGFRRSARMQILPLQYAEVCAYFIRQRRKFSLAVLDPLEIVTVGVQELVAAADLYLRARAAGSKASLADAVLAATVRNRGGVLYAFDEDFRHLGLQQESIGRWTPA
ncbi:MAG TPA: PIN domain-containing protein [Thermoanaerobaculia bacterium]|nr:PIN domain-containing protein [Thermoanaerobaculia bacterium]